MIIRISLAIAAMAIIGCYPVSHIIVGERAAAISAFQVEIYADYPAVYEKIAILDAGSGFAIKDPAFPFTWQAKMDKVVERLKNEAALLGANGIVMMGTDNKVIQTIGSNSEGNMTSNSYLQKIGKAMAIYVP